MNILRNKPIRPRPAPLEARTDARDSQKKPDARLLTGTVSNGMRVLQIGADRSKRGILHRGSLAFARQEAYAKQFGNLDIVAFSLRSDGAGAIDAGPLRIYPTNSLSKLLYVSGAVRIALALSMPAVVSTQDPFETGLVGWIISRIKKVPLHVQVHTDFLSPSYARHSFANRLRVFVAGFILRRASRIRVVSGRIKTALLQSYRLRSPVSVLPIFVDINELQNVRADEGAAKRAESYDTKLLVVSRLEPEKNVGLAIRAFADVAPQTACLIIVGDGSEKENLERLAKDVGVSERIFFEGAQTPKKYYKLASLVLMPSLYEGYGMVIIEALASGVPVLSTGVGVAREVGAIVASKEEFNEALAQWFNNGPREGTLKNYPYQDFNEYIRAYCGDIVSCVESEKGHT